MKNAQTIEHEAWVGIDCLEEFLGIDDLRLVDAALAFASTAERRCSAKQDYPNREGISLESRATLAR